MTGVHLGGDKAAHVIQTADDRISFPALVVEFARSGRENIRIRSEQIGLVRGVPQIRSDVTVRIALNPVLVLRAATDLGEKVLILDLQGVHGILDGPVQILRKDPVRLPVTGQTHIYPAIIIFRFLSPDPALTVQDRKILIPNAEELVIDLGLAAFHRVRHRYN